MANKIISTKFIKNVKTPWGDLAFCFASMTNTYWRPTLEQSIKDSFSKTMETAEVPPETAKAVLLEKVHTSASDNEEHYTVGLLRADDTYIKTAHIKPKNITESAPGTKPEDLVEWKPFVEPGDIMRPKKPADPKNITDPAAGMKPEDLVDWKPFEKVEDVMKPKNNKEAKDNIEPKDSTDDP